MILTWISRTIFVLWIVSLGELARSENESRSQLQPRKPAWLRHSSPTHATTPSYQMLDAAGRREMDKLAQIALPSSVAVADQVEDQSSSQPTGQPSSTPTSEPTSEPTIPPTSQPSSKLTSEPTSEPTNPPTSRPSSQPTSEPTSEPTIPPTSQPSSQPSGLPTSQPTNQPTVIPTGQPSSLPTSLPTGRPTFFPTQLPTSHPTQLPTPVGELGSTWWWLVICRSTLWSSETLAIYGTQSVASDVQSAFWQVLTQGMDATTSAAITIQAELVSNDANAEHSVPQKPSLAAGELTDGPPYHSTYQVTAWCATQAAYLDVWARMHGLAINGHPLVPPLQQEGLYTVTDVTVANVTHHTTSEPPPSSSDADENSPTQIILIILGTLLAFVAAWGLLSLFLRVRQGKSCAEIFSSCACCGSALKPLVDCLCGESSGYRNFFSSNEDEEDSFGQELSTSLRSTHSSRHHMGTMKHLNIHFRDKYDDFLHEANGNEEDLRRKREDFLAKGLPSQRNGSGMGGSLPRSSPSVIAGSGGGSSNPLHGWMNSSTHSAGSDTSSVGFENSIHNKGNRSEADDDLVEISLSFPSLSESRRPPSTGYMTLFGRGGLQGGRGHSESRGADDAFDDGVI